VPFQSSNSADLPYPVGADAPTGACRLKGGSRWGWLDRAVRKHGRSGRRKHEGRMWLSTHG